MEVCKNLLWISQFVWNWIVMVLGMNHSSDCSITETITSGVYAPSQICSKRLIFEEQFDKLDPNKWLHEISMAGGGNWEFQMYTKDPKNSFVKDGVLYIKPSLTSDLIGEQGLYTEKFDLGKECNNPDWYGCVRQGTQDNIINPIRSAKIQTKNSFRFRYGKVEIRAKLPVGDWLWPAIWLLPVENKYGSWPVSGEIDMVESRGNKALTSNGVNIGIQEVSSTLHWGTDTEHNRFTMTTYSSRDPRGYVGDFHVYSLEWTSSKITFAIDGKITGYTNVPNGGFYELGHFADEGIDNVYATGDRMAPFDREFYLIINLAVGGTNHYFPDNANNPTPKPWKNTSPTSARDFWSARENWLPTWNLQDDGASFQIDYVRIYAI